MIDAGGRIGRNFAPERQQENVSLFGALADHVKARRKDGPVVIASYSDGRARAADGLMEDEGIGRDDPGGRDVPDVGKARRASSPSGRWSTGSRGRRMAVTVISEQDVLGDRLIRQTEEAARAENFLTEAQALSPGDLVVHVDHGVGRYHGLEVVTARARRTNACTLEYAERRRCTCRSRTSSC